MATGLLTRAGGLLASVSVRAWMRTLDYRVAYYDPAVDPAHDQCVPGIYVFWHEYIMFPLYLRGHCHLAMLLSRHRDADILARVAHHFGYDCIRGSTYRGAATAVREMIRRDNDTHLAITPDGPRGPRRCLAQGPSLLGIASSVAAGTVWARL